MKLSLDTNVYTALFRGDKTIADYVKRAEHVHISAVVAGELLSGFRNGSRYEANRRGLDDFLLSTYVSLLPVTLVAAERFGRIAASLLRCFAASLRRKGRPIPSNDIWIAAHTMESGSELLSFDKHFKEVDGLAWVVP